MVQLGRVVVALLVIGSTAVVYGQVTDTGGATSVDLPCQHESNSVPPGGCSTPQERAATSPPPQPKRIFGVIPNFTTTDDAAGKQGPLEPHRKFALALHQMFDISAHFGNLLQASIQQATNGQPHYQTVSFGKRLAAAEGDQAMSSLFIYGVLPTLLHDDPRYFRRDSGSALSRVWYAASRTFVSRNDAGANILNTPQLAGQLMQAGFSNLYYPESDRGLNGTMVNWATQLAYNSAFNLLKEFYPDMLEKLHRHKTQSSK